jgi:hypothetical protein
MIGRIRKNWRSGLLLAPAAALAFVALTVGSSPAQAFWIGFGGPCCGYWPGAYYAPPPPAYYPPPGYYPPAPAYSPGYSSSYSGGYYPQQPAGPAPSAYTPAAPSVGTPPSAPAAVATPAITYTNKPAFTNSAGQTCREYKTGNGGHDIFGTACKEADGQWRVVN